jgi:hypothetical protein
MLAAAPVRSAQCVAVCDEITSDQRRDGRDNIHTGVMSAVSLTERTISHPYWDSRAITTAEGREVSRSAVRGGRAGRVRSTAIGGGRSAPLTYAVSVPGRTAERCRTVLAGADEARDRLEQGVREKRVAWSRVLSALRGRRGVYYGAAEDDSQIRDQVRREVCSVFNMDKERSNGRTDLLPLRPV